MEGTTDTKLYRQLQATKSAALRLGPLHPNRKDAAFVRYRHYARLWGREEDGIDGRQTG